MSHHTPATLRAARALRIAAFACAWFAATAWAQQPPAASPWSASANAFYGAQGKADLDNGGEVDLSFGGLGVELSYAAGHDWSAGVSLGANRFRFGFSGSGPIASQAPWSDVTAASIGLPLFYSLSERWSLFALPTIEWAGTSDADRGDSSVYGGLLAASYAFEPRQRIGLGVAYFTGLEDSGAFPVLLVDWQIDDNWRLANPLTTGPTGGPGLEVIRTLGGGWELAAGGVYRSLRFRLDQNLSAAPNGVGEYSGGLGFLRLTRNFGESVSLEFFVGAEFGGRIKLMDSQGNDLRVDDVSTAPLLAISLTGRF
jgi:hypothetical protein